MGILGTPLGYIMYWIDLVVQNYGLSLILFVLLTKVVLFPLTIKQQMTTSKTAAFQPKLQELQKKYAKNKQKYQEEMMKLYEQEGINPMGGCMPMLIQFLLLFGIIDVIYKPLKHLLHIPADLIKQASELMAKTSAVEIDIITAIQNKSVDFSGIFTSDMIQKIQDFDMNFLGFNMGAIPKEVMGWIIIIPILSGVTAFLTSWISMRQQSSMGTQVNGMLKGMMYFMPLMSLWIAFTLPAGVGMYWVVSNLFAVVQTVVISKIYTPDRIMAMSAKNSEKNKGKNQEKLRKRREKMEKYNQMMVDKGLEPKYKVAGKPDQEDQNSPEVISKKEAEKRKIAEARKRLAEKYGDEYDAE